MRTDRAPVSARAVIVATRDQVSCDLNGEVAVLGLKNGVYYGLDPVATRIWQLVQKPTTLEEVLAQVLLEYDVTRTRCERDVHALIRDLAHNGLIEIRDEPAG